MQYKSYKDANKIINKSDYLVQNPTNNKNKWNEMLTKVQINTPYESLNIMLNGWIMYQTITSRLLGRSGFYQSGGAIGYRDQLQDTMSLISSWPEKTRAQIILNSSKQFEKGDVLHWWHNHTGAGIRTYFSDDYLWLPYVLSEYILKTGDDSILKEKAPWCKTVVGGAVLTQEYADKIGADKYAKDAMETVRFAEEIFK